MPDQWFSNRGQIIQISIGAAAIVVAVILNKGVPDAPPWLVPALLGAGLTALVLFMLPVIRAKPPIHKVLDEHIELVGFEFRAEEGATYKRKLFLTFQNNNGGPIIVGPQTRWLPGLLPVNTPQDHAWRVERPNSAWTEEAYIVQVDPGERFRTWVGLLNTTSKEDFDRVDKRQWGRLSASIVKPNRVAIDLT